MFKALIVTLVGLFFTITSVVSLLNGRALESRGKTAEIEPPETVTQVTRKKNNAPVDVHYEGHLTFVTEAGEPVTVKKNIPQPLLERMMHGEAATVRYLPDKPTIARLEGEYGASEGEVAFGVLVLLVGGAWFMKKLRETPKLD